MKSLSLKQQQKKTPSSSKKKKQTRNFDQQYIEEQELQRLQELTSYEEAAKKNGFRYIVGIDEAGRGPLAGPVVAASCYFPENFYFPGINDSKKLTPAKRAVIYQNLINCDHVDYHVSIIDHSIIDEINIYQATILAMKEAVKGLSITPDYLLVDGLDLQYPGISGEGIIKGDQHSILIAAASIIAKETRDALMLDYHKQWPEYGFDKHKGYGTAQHRQAISEYGPCPIHRKSFEPIKSIVLQSGFTPLIQV